MNEESRKLRESLNKVKLQVMSRNLNFSKAHKSLSKDKDLMMIKGIVVNKSIISPAVQLN